MVRCAAARERVVTRRSAPAENDGAVDAPGRRVRASPAPRSRHGAYLEPSLGRLSLRAALSAWALLSEHPPSAKTLS